MRPQTMTRRMSLALPAMALLAAALPGAGDAHDAPVQDGLNRAMAATLVVAAADRDGRFLGSAVLWGDGRFAVTAAHVVGNRERVLLRNVAGISVLAHVVRRDAARDVAFLELADKSMGTGLAPRPGPVQLAETVYAIGAPFAVDQTLTRGIVSSGGRQVDPAIPVVLIQHDAAINAGSSGGPLVDSAGQLLGINAELASSSRFYVGLSYALPAQLLADVFSQSLKPVPELGLRLRPVDGMIAEALALDAQTGLLVDYVSPGGTAETAGMAPGDIVVALDGQAIVRPGDLALSIEARTAPHARLGLTRGGTPHDVTLRFATPNSGLISSGSQAIAFVPPAQSRTTIKALGITLASRRVTAIAATSPAYFAGLSVGDDILAFNGIPVRERGFLWPDITGPVLFLLRGVGRQTRHVAFDPFTNEQAMRPINGAVVLDPAVISL
ncbi:MULTISPECIES: trypsin-like peptidase domain-containing protein [unclassified Marinovum]